MNIFSPKNLRIIFKTLSSLSNERGDSPEQNKLNTTPVRTFRNSPTKIDFQNNMKTLTLTRMEQATLIKDMLNLPKDLKELLTLLTSKQSTSEIFTGLLQTKTIKINPEIIQQLLESNSKEVINKLIKLVQQTPGNTQSYDQLKPLLALLSQIIPHKNAAPQEILTQLILLYLPWLPLMEQQKIEVRFEKKKSGSSEEDEKIAMIIYVSTINLGRFKATIIIDKTNKPNISIEHITKNGKKDNIIKDTLKNILKTLNFELTEEKIEAKTYLSEVKQENFKKSGKREVTISKVNSLSPIVLITAQKISRIILEFDEKISLLEKRKQSSSK